MSISCAVLMYHAPIVIPAIAGAQATHCKTTTEAMRVVVVVKYPTISPRPTASRTGTMGVTSILFFAAMRRSWGNVVTAFVVLPL